MTRPTSAIIDTSALRDNFALAQKLGPSAKSMPMVKANAYGHGMVEVAHELKDMAPAYGVACIEEALALRQSNIKQPILLLEGPHSADEIGIAEKHGFWLMLENHNQLQAILSAHLSNPIPLD